MINQRMIEEVKQRLIKTYNPLAFIFLALMHGDALMKKVT